MIRALAITGPTASGKTALSIEVAKKLSCEIISLDSMQIYRYMDIGTAKATKEEQRAVKHHMIDFLSPDENFSAKAYRDMAMAIAEEIQSRGKTPLFVGGTGLYLSTLIRPECEMAPESDAEYRDNIEKTLFTEEDRIKLWERLNAVDPDSAAAVHYNNTRRVIRAIEIFEKTGKTKTYFDALTKRRSEDIDLFHVTLDFYDRDLLYKRVDKRVDLMLRDGLIDEVRDLLDKGYLNEDTTAAQAIGYKEMIALIKSGGDPLSAAESIKQASRNYAKRQLTWFRHMEGANVLYVDMPDGEMKEFDALCAECIDVFLKHFD